MLGRLSFVQFISSSALIEANTFVLYILVYAALFKSRFSRLATVLALCAAGVVIVGMNTAVMLQGEDTLILMLLPLTAYLPFSVLLYFLSDSGIFETAAVCSVGALEVLILKSLQKILICSADMEVDRDSLTYMDNVMHDVVVILAAAGLVFIAFRFIGKAFRSCVIENRQNRPLLSAPITMIFLMMFYYLNSTTNVTTLIFTILIALSIFFVNAKLLNSGAELIRVRRSEDE